MKHSLNCSKLVSRVHRTRLTTPVSTAVLETASGGWNASRTRDGRPRQADRRRPVSIWVRDDHRIREGPEGSLRRYGPLHLSQEERTGLDAGMAARGLSPLADHDGTDLGARQLSEDRLSGSLLLRGAEAEEAAFFNRRNRSRNSQDLREAR